MRYGESALAKYYRLNCSKWCWYCFSHSASWVAAAGRDLRSFQVEKVERVDILAPMYAFPVVVCDCIQGGEEPSPSPAGRGKRDEDGKGLRRQHPLGHAEHILRALGQFAHNRGFKAGVHETVLTQGVFAFFPVVPIHAVPELVPCFEVFLAD